MGSKTVIKPKKDSNASLDKINEEQRIRDFLYRTGTAESELTLTAENTSFIIRGNFLEFKRTDTEFRVRLKDFTLLEEHTEKNESIACTFAVHIKGEGIVIFQGVYLEHEDDIFTFEVPPKILRMQRRKDYRYDIPGAYELRIQFKHPKMQDMRVDLRLSDISLSGCSFLISPRDTTAYPKDMAVQNAEIQIRGAKVIVSFETRNLLEHKKNPKEKWYRVGVEFKKISDADRELLATYIAEHQVQYNSFF